MGVETNNYQIAAEFIYSASSILIGAGAGMGVDSGLPDFRGNEGFWNSYPHLRNLAVSFEDMANSRWFRDEPYLAWGFYGHRYNLYRRTRPHIGFKILLKWISLFNLDHFVYTSNVDEHFQKAGFPREKVYECHGSLKRFQCNENCGHHPWIPHPQFEVQINKASHKQEDPLPDCPKCSGIARPNLLMFSDWSWDSEIASKQQRKLSEWLLTKEKGLVVIETGAGTSIPTVRIACESAAFDSGGYLVRINPREAKTAQPGISISHGAKKALEKIDALIQKI